MVKPRFRQVLPVFLTAIIAILSALASQGSSKNKPVIRDIYQVKIDMRNVNFTAFIPSYAREDYSNITENLSFEESGLYEIYTVGTRYYCKGDMNGKKYEVAYCTSRSYYFNPFYMLQEDLSSRNSDFHSLTPYDLSIPEFVPSFTNVPQTTNVKVIYFALLVGFILDLPAFLLYTINLFKYEAQSSGGSLFACLSMFALIIGGGVSTQLYGAVKRGFQGGAEEYGIKASWGNNQYYIFLWMAISLQILNVFSRMFFVIFFPLKKAKDPSTQDTTVEEQENAIETGEPTYLQKPQMEELPAYEHLNTGSTEHNQSAPPPGYFHSQGARPANTSEGMIQSSFISGPSFNNSGVISYNVNAW